MSVDRFSDAEVFEVSRPHWIVRVVTRLETWARPWLGWGTLFACMALSMLPAVALRANRWVALGNLQSALEWSGPLAVLCVWLLWGWRRPVARGSRVISGIAVVLVGPFIISQLVLGWIPGPVAWVRALIEGRWVQLAFEVGESWLRAFTRAQLWWEGVLAGGAAQDNLVFAVAGSLLLWLIGALCGWLARRTRQGYAAAAPALWLLGLILLYSSEGRYLLISGLALTMALHMFLDHRVLVERWRQQQLDFSPGILMDRILMVFGTGALILALAAIMPNLYIDGLVNAYYGLLAPVNARMEALGERLFPDVRGTSRLRGGSGDGLPNEFLLQGGPALGSAVVMRVRTDESQVYQVPYNQFPYDEMAAPPGHYMRGATYAFYDGHGWSNSVDVRVRQIAENERWLDDDLWGRKIVIQSVIMEAGSPLLFAAPEPVEASVAVRLEERGPGDQLRINAREQSYAVVSAVPAVNEAMLRELPTWEEVEPLPDGHAAHLQLPEQVSERTRALAAELIADQPTAYDRALAIESYLRQYTYDLEVDAPPDDIVDVADYFLFELGRGYCDYYATAFVVLARLAGLPARFATGYAVGQWNPVDAVWVVTEAEAHSWPEVFFPEVGWIPFEPTAGRPTLARIGTPAASSPSSAPAVIPPEFVPEAEDATWNWQLLFWLLPLGLLVWGGWWLVVQWQRRSQDPWLTILQWGRQAGRPIGEGETVLEYGRELANFVLVHTTTAQDAARFVAREIEAVSLEVNAFQYAPSAVRTGAQQALLRRWDRLRSYLRLVRLH